MQQDPGWRKAGELTDFGLRFALVILLSVLGGWKLDKMLGTLPWFTLAGTLFGFAAGFGWLLLKLKDTEE